MSFKLMLAVFVSLLFTSLRGQKIDLPFDANEVISQASGDYASQKPDFPLTPDSRTGEFLIDTQITYIGGHANQQEDPAIAFDGTNYLIVWSDERNDSVTGYDIYGARVSPDGVVLDQPAIAISTAVRDQQTPAIAFDGMGYFVVWADVRSNSWGIYGARISQLGIVLDTVGIVVSDIPGFYNDETKPSIAWGETCYLIAWERHSDIYAARVTQSGIVLDTSAIPLDTGYMSEHLSDIAFDGSNFLVVWDRWTYSSASGHILRIRGARVNQSGTVLNTNHIAGDRASEPSICFDGTNYVVVWTQGLDSLDISARRVSQEGLPIGPSVPICTEAGHQEKPSVGFDGSNYIIVWQDRRSGDWDIRGAEVDTSCSNIDEFAVSLQSGDQSAPALAHGQNDQVLTTWSGLTDSINGEPAFTMRIWGNLSPYVGLEEHSDLRERAHKQYLQVYPNPVHNECHINYSLVNTANVNVSLFDVTGRLITDIIDEDQEIGYHERVFCADDLPQGVYFIRFETDSHSETSKVIFVK